VTRTAVGPGTPCLLPGPGQTVSALPEPPPAPDPAGPLVPAPSVTAVLVTGGPAEPEHLRRAAGALAAQTRPPDTVVAVGTGGRPPEEDVLRRIAGHVLRVERRVGFGDGVRAAVAALDSLAGPRAEPRAGTARDAVPGGPRAATGPGGAGPASWLWLVHDDCAPAPEALARLLDAVERGPSIGVAGCKQVSWEDDQQLRDVGFTTSRLGTRVTGLDLFEVDQGQHDERSDVLAVCEAGMLVRRDVWDALGGTDPALGPARADLDLCCRARLAGHRVVVVPEAVVAHAGCSPTGDLPRRGTAHRSDRRSVLHLRLAGTPLLLLPLAVLGILVSTPLRAAAALLVGRPVRALDEILAAARALLGPVALLRTRGRLRRGRRVPRRTLRPLLATRRQLWLHHRNGSVVRRAARGMRNRRAQARARPPAAGGRRAPGPGPGRAAPRVLHAVPSPATAPAPAQGTAAAAGPAPAPATDPAPGTGSGSAAEPDPAATATVPVAAALTSTSAAPVPGPVPSPRPDPAGADLPDGTGRGSGTGAAGRGRRPGLPVRSRGMTGDRSPAARRRGSGPAVLAALAITLAAGLVGLGELLRPGTPQGPFLMPVPGSASQLWRSANAGWRTAGLGSAAVADPADLVLALLALLTGGDPGRAVTLLLLAGAPLSALVGYWAAGRFTPARAVRWWAGLGWGCAPTLLTALAQGRVAAVLAHALLPLPALAVARALDLGGRRGERHRAMRDLPRPVSLRAAVLAGLLLTAVLACAPSLALPAAGILLVLAAVSGRRGPMLLITLLLPLALLLPWWWAVAGDQRLLLADPSPGAGTGQGTGSPWWHLLGYPDSPRDVLGPAALGLRSLAGPDLPAGAALLGIALATTLPLLGPAVAGLARGGRAGRGALLSWGIGLAGAATAVAAERVGVAGTARATATGWAGPGTSLFTAGILAAGLCLWSPGPAGGGPDPGPRRRARSPRAADRGRGRGRAGAATAAALLLALAGPVTTLALWARQCATDGADLLQVRPAPADVLPGLAAAEGLGPAAARTLVLRAGGQRVTWSLASGGGPRLGGTCAALAAEETGPDGDGTGAPSTDDVVRPVVAELLSGTERDLRGDLTDLAVGSVYAVDPVPDSTANALDSSPGLVRASTDAGGVLWRVEPAADGGRATRPAWARVLDGDGRITTALPSTGSSIDTRLPAGEGDRTLALSARQDPGWRASLDGRPLTPSTRGGWAQAFELPGAGGRLVVRHDGPGPAGSGTARGLILLTALLLLLPLRASRRQVLLPRPSRPVTRGRVAAAQGAAPAPRVYDAEHPEQGELDPVLTEPPRRSRRRPARRAGPDGGGERRDPGAAGGGGAPRALAELVEAPGAVPHGGDGGGDLPRGGAPRQESAPPAPGADAGTGTGAATRAGTAADPGTGSDEGPGAGDRPADGGPTGHVPAGDARPAQGGRGTGERRDGAPGTAGRLRFPRGGRR